MDSLQILSAVRHKAGASPVPSSPYYFHDLLSDVAGTGLAAHTIDPVRPAGVSWVEQGESCGIVFDTYDGDDWAKGIVTYERNSQRICAFNLGHSDFRLQVEMVGYRGNNYQLASPFLCFRSTDLLNFWSIYMSAAETPSETATFMFLKCVDDAMRLPDSGTYSATAEMAVGEVRFELDIVCQGTNIQISVTYGGVTTPLFNETDPFIQTGTGLQLAPYLYASPPTPPLIRNIRMTAL